MSFNELFSSNSNSSPAREEHWIPLSDLMTGLMMMFMLIAVVFMVKVEAESKQVKDVAVVYETMRNQLHADLLREFEADLPRWGAELTPDLTLRFKEPEVLFDIGKDSLKPKFRAILDNFFPRYVQILSGDKYRESIDEIRIEGHTSSVWNNQTSEDDAYFLNMDLSQARTRMALRYVLSLPAVAYQKSWLRSHMTANGLSSSKLVFASDGSESKAASQRVEFRVRTNADERIEQILQTVQQ